MRNVISSSDYKRNWDKPVSNLSNSSQDQCLQSDREGELDCVLFVAFPQQTFSCASISKIDVQNPVFDKIEKLFCYSSRSGVFSMWTLERKPSFCFLGSGVDRGQPLLQTINLKSPCRILSFLLWFQNLFSLVCLRHEGLCIPSSP